MADSSEGEAMPEIYNNSLFDPMKDYEFHPARIGFISHRLKTILRMASKTLTHKSGDEHHTLVLNALLFALELNEEIIRTSYKYPRHNSWPVSSDVDEQVIDLLSMFERLSPQDQETVAQKILSDSKEGAAA